MTLIGESVRNIERWVKEQAFPGSQLLADHHGGNLTSVEHLWVTMEQVDLVSSNRQAYSKKIVNIETLINKMEEEVMSAPAPVDPEDKDS